MTTSGERVEFVVAPADLAVRAGDDGDAPPAPDELDGRDAKRPATPAGRRTAALLVAAVVALALGVVGIRSLTGSDAPTAVTPERAAPDGVVNSGLITAGQAGLPATFGAAVDVVASPSGSDSVWVLGARGQIARLDDGTVGATSSPATTIAAMAATADGRFVYAATTGAPAVLLRLDSESLEVKDRWSLDRTVEALAVTDTAVWTAGGGTLAAWSTATTSAPRATAEVASVSTWRSLRVTSDGAILGVGADAAGGFRLVTGNLAAGGISVVTSPGLAGPVSAVSGESLLVARVRSGVSMVDRLGGAPGPSWGPFPVGASIWPVAVSDAAIGAPDSGAFDYGPRADDDGPRWALALPDSSGITCFGAAGGRVGSAILGTSGAGLSGPIVATDRAFYGITGDGHVTRGGRGSCR